MISRSSLPLRSAALGTARRSTTVSIGMSLLLIVLGLLALMLPGALGIAVAILALWTIVFAGLAHLVYAWNVRTAGDRFWGLAVGLVYLLAGLYLMLHPRESLTSLTLVLAVLFLLEAGAMLGAFLRLRALPGSGWLLMNALLAFALGLLLAFNWPSRSPWAIGTLLGINLLVSGAVRLLLSWRGTLTRFFPQACAALARKSPPPR
ncbi:MAG: HdeD family acid-resistance protein [Gammaproteobacteria bacterium]